MTDANNVLGLAPGHVFSDALQVHPDECVELVAHHLRLAALFYQSTPEDLAAVNAEIRRLLLVKHSDDDPAVLGADAFLGAIRRAYEEMKKNDI